MLSFTLLLSLLVCALAQDPSGKLDGVVDLTVQNFYEHVGESNHVLIEFYAPWCGWCKKLVPTWTDLGKLVSTTDTNVKIAKFDATQADSSEIKTAFGVRGFPTIVLVKAGTKAPLKFTGTRSVDGFVDFIKQKTGVNVQSGSTEATEEPASEPSASTAAAAPGTVVSLNPSNFDSIVLDSTKDVFVKFFAPWCGHCVRMAPAWEELAKSQSKVVIAELDASQHSEVGSRFGVRGFPTLKFFSKSDKSGNIVYKGQRDLASFKAFVDQQVN
jgi:protein disulfide-isomerase-like protein